MSKVIELHQMRLCILKIIAVHITQRMTHLSCSMRCLAALRIFILCAGKQHDLQFLGGLR